MSSPSNIATEIKITGGPRSVPEYKFFGVTHSLSHERELNELAEKGWRVVCSFTEYDPRYTSDNTLVLERWVTK